MEGTLIKKGKKWTVRYAMENSVLEFPVDLDQATILDVSKHNHKVIFEKIWTKEKWIALITFKTI